MKAHRLLFCIVLFVLSFTIARAQGITISGTIYNDPNGLTDHTINGTPKGGYFTYLFDPASGTVISTTMLNLSTYSFTGLAPNSIYNIAISSQLPIVGQPKPSNSQMLHVFTFTGEGATPAGDGTPNGVTSVSLGTQDVANVNFGINFLPTAYRVESTLANPGGITKVQVPTLKGFDSEDGNYNGVSGTNTIIINSLPAEGLLYYQDVPVAVGDTIHNYIPRPTKDRSS